ncbi:MAG TPA: DUF1553 domain-containing protein [Prosthecobacter sp.]|nr:DUF1553 domain-containing protein [Prosthecobacter sp.]HRK14804.1 DUF1553 domain-containing protein [Prosthecobacter sp.]
MKTILHSLAISLLFVLAVRAEQPVDVYRTWTDTQGRKVDATFRGFEDGQVFLQTKDGQLYRFEIGRLGAEDQKAALSMKPTGLGIPADPAIAMAAAKVDALVDAGLRSKNQRPNPLASDEQFVRRVYLDIVGRIPTRDEALELIEDQSVSKRAKLIDRLLAGDGANSHLYNYFADMLRIRDIAGKLGVFYTYQEWLKGELKKNTGWDKIVHQMLTAEGKLLENGATGYLLRDDNMPLDSLSLTLTSFLGADVGCAQCHDHPFADWTQRQFYEMAAFFGATDTNGGKGKDRPGTKELREAMAVIAEESRQRKEKNPDAGRDKSVKLVIYLERINGFSVYDDDVNELKLPHDYKYKDGKPGDLVTPKLLTWSKEDARLAAYREFTATGGREPEQLRAQFAKWLTAPDNPRFAMTIANRMWKRAFGLGVREPVSDLDDPAAASNPPLLQHLAREMVRVKFDLKAFMRILYNTQTYQREATSHDIDLGQPYLFPGPLLRRMTAEQAWDSCATLAVGTAVDQFHSERAEKYVSIKNINTNASPAEILEQVRNAIARNADAPNVSKEGKGAKIAMQTAKNLTSTDEDGVSITPPMLGEMVIARASELLQPEREYHFLRQFGQSDRQLSDSNSDEGHIPQVLMLMNGAAQDVIGSTRSLAVQKAQEQAAPEARIESLYVSFFCRKPTAREVTIAKELLSSDLTLSDLAWVLFNTREFIFVE